MDHTDTADREHLIAGLRAFADFLESRTEVPAPAYPRLLAFVRRDDDAEGSAEVDRVADLVGEQIDPDQMEYGHCSVTKHFGPVEYGAVYITRAAKARHDADDSYRGHVRPEEV